MKKEILRMENVTVETSQGISLDNMNLSIYKGEILGLLNLNDQGKNELVDLLRDDIPMKYGRIYLNGKLVKRYDMKMKRNHQVYAIGYKSGLIPDLSVAENIFVIRRGFKKYFINYHVLAKQVEHHMGEMGININPRELVCNLSPLEKCEIELLKAVLLGENVIVLYEISNILGAVELQVFQNLLRECAKRGYTFLYMGSHHEEVFSITDRACLLQDGHVVKILNAGELTEAHIIPFMQLFLELKKMEPTEKRGEIFSFYHICTEHLKEFTCVVQKGECITILDENNRMIHELFAILKGEAKADSGELYYDGKRLARKRIKKILGYEMAVIAENATQSMLFWNLSYIENLMFMIDRKLGKSRIPGKIKKSIYEEYEKKVGMEIYANSLSELESESLYNLIYEKCLLYKSKIVFCVQPFLGGDMYLRRHIVELIRNLKKEGIAVVILAVRLADCLSVSDRLLMVKDGELLREYSKGEYDQIQENFYGYV